MPLDLTRLPHPRRASFFAPEPSDLPAVGHGSAAFHVEHLLIEEMAYAATTAEQAITNRDFIFKQQLLVVFGALAIGGVALAHLYLGHARGIEIRPLALVVALVVGAVGTIAFLMLVQFHVAFSDSMRTLRVLYDYYKSHLEMPPPRLDAQMQWRRLHDLEKIHFALKNLTLGLAFTLTSALGLGLAAGLTIMVMHGDTSDVLSPPRDVSLLGAATIAFFTIAVQLVYYYLRVGRTRE